MKIYIYALFVLVVLSFDLNAQENTRLDANSLSFSNADSINSSISYDDFSGVLSLKVRDFCSIDGTSNVDRMVITGCGNIGMGTSSPGANLHIRGTEAFSNQLLRLDGFNSFLSFYDGNDYKGYIQSLRDDLKIWNLKAANMSFGTNDLERMTITADGNIGMGTFSPFANLHIKGSETALDEVLRLDGESPYLSFYDGSDYRGYIWMTGSDDMEVWNRKFGSLIFGTDNVERMSIIENGDVGIGTISPSANLHIKGSPTALDEVLRLDGESPFLSFYDGSDYRGYIWMTDSDDMQVWNRKAGSLVFGTNSVGRMTIASDGNIGIGTTAPSARLEINHDSGGALGDHLELNEIGTDDFARLRFATQNSGDYWNIAAATGTRDEFNIFYGSPTFNNNFISITRGDFNMKVDADIIPFEASDMFDLGKNNSTQHWDDCVADDFINFSDKRLKRNIETMDETLSQLMQLRPVTYQYINKHNKDGRLRTGFIAQEVREVYPEVVVDEDVDVDQVTGELIHTKSDYLSMNYIELIPITIKAVQELNKKIEENETVKAELASLKNEIEELKALIANLPQIQTVELTDDGTPTKTARLNQNTPNPFNGVTTISYFIPKEITQAILQITDVNGKVIKRVDIAKNGQGTLEIDATQLQNGQYFYSLILDGKLFESKQMLLAK
ncbi:MAG: tail fiber domain-containing protein [Bacteroidota bacterium]